MSFPEPTLKDPLTIIQHGTEKQVVLLHCTVRGKVVTIVTPTGENTFIRVLPTSHPKLALVLTSKTIVWANVCWLYGMQKWVCSIMNLPGSTERLWDSTEHRTLKGAVRHARKAVQKNAGQPDAHWSKILAMVPNLGIYPSDNEILRSRQYERDYLQSVKVDILHNEPDYGDYSADLYQY